MRSSQSLPRCLLLASGPSTAPKDGGSCAVNPGFGGQGFIQSQVKKIKKLREMCNEYGVNPWIEVDGGVTPKNAAEVGISSCLPDL